MTETPCPVCDGRGGFVHQTCCGRGRSECCGEPDTDFERCHACGGCGSLPIKDMTDDTHNTLRQEKPDVLP